MKVSKLCKDRTCVDIGGGRFTGLGLKIGHRQVYRFGPQNQASVGLPVWSLKPGAHLVRSDGGEEGMLRHHGACAKTKKNPEDRASIRCSEKDLDGFTLEGYLGCMLNGMVFWSWPGAYIY